MATRIVLHIGPRKTGSTFLQQTLTALAPVLLEHDVLYPLAGEQITLDLDDGVKSNYPKLGPALKKVAGLS